MSINQQPTQRQIRFSEVIREIVSDSINKIDILNSEVEIVPITVSFVKLSKDLKLASVYIMPLGGNNKEKILNLLNENKYFFQKAISNEKLKSKHTPKLRFFLDDSFEEAQKIEKLLLNKNVKRDLK